MKTVEKNICKMVKLKHMMKRWRPTSHSSLDSDDSCSESDSDVKDDDPMHFYHFLVCFDDRNRIQLWNFLIAVKIYLRDSCTCSRWSTCILLLLLLWLLWERDRERCLVLQQHQHQWGFHAVIDFVLQMKSCCSSTLKESFIICPCHVT